MSNRNHKKRVNQKTKKIHSNIFCIFISFLLIIIGIILSLEISISNNLPEWVQKGLIIKIASEKNHADINVTCDVEENGSVTLSLYTGEQVEDPIKIWILTEDFYYPFQWEVDGIEHVVLDYAYNTGSSSDKNTFRETSLNDNYYPEERKFIAEKTGYKEGEAEKNKAQVYMECFSTTLEPGKSNYYIHFQMDTSHTEYRSNGDINIRMPFIISSRDAAIYYMPVNDIMNIPESGTDDLLPYFSTCMIDENALFTPTLSLESNYTHSVYSYEPNYTIKSVLPEPKESFFNSPFWEENLQWVPYLVFHDLNYDKQDITKNWFGSMLITVGSALLVQPLPAWIKSTAKRKKR